MQDLVPLLSPTTNTSSLKSSPVESSAPPTTYTKLSDASSSMSFHDIMTELIFE